MAASRAIKGYTQRRERDLYGLQRNNVPYSGFFRSYLKVVEELASVWFIRLGLSFLSPHAQDPIFLRRAHARANGRVSEYHGSSFRFLGVSAVWIIDPTSDEPL